MGVAADLGFFAMHKLWARKSGRGVLLQRLRLAARSPVPELRAQQPG
jgi:hypothetical protein